MHSTNPEEKEQNFLFEFAPCAEYKENIQNTNCQGSTDSMIYYLRNNIGSIGGNGWLHLGCASYTASGFSKVPMGTYYHEWHVTRNGSTQIFYDTTELNAGDQVTYNLNY